MDLKKRFTALGIEEPVVAKFLPVISPEEAAVFYNCSDEELKSKIPELLERIVNKPSQNEELDLNNIGLKTPGSGAAGNFPPPQQKAQAVPVGVPNILEPALPQKKSPVLKVLGFILLTLGLVLILSGLNKKNDEISNKPKEEKKKNLITTEVKELKKVEVEEPTLPYPPDFRAAWMFLPWDNYVPAIICNDGRFKEIKEKFTVQFWIKLTQKFPEKVGLFAFFGNKQPIESIFINEAGILCFSPGPKKANLALLKPLPDNGRHFHIAITRDGELCRLYVNGKMRQEMKVPLNKETPVKDFITLFNSDSTLKGIGIDELMISNDILFEDNFTPERILTMSESTVLYMPFEKGDDSYFKCYGFKKYHEQIYTGGKWLNVQNEVQQVINHLEFSQETETP